MEKFNLLNKKIRVSYNSLANEVSRDSGILQEENDEFFILEVDVEGEKRIKYISKNKTIRVEVLE